MPARLAAALARAAEVVLVKMMSDGLLDAVFATTTVAAGVNFPARTIALLNSDRFNGTQFLPLDPTEFHQMTGRAGRRGMDNIGFALAIPGRYMDVAHILRLLKSPPSDVASQIRINFSMVLNLLMSHPPGQIEDLLRRSFAAHQLGAARRKRREAEAVHAPLWADFKRHLELLRNTGFVNERDELTEDGRWASRLRVDQPLLIAEGFRQGVFPRDPALLAAIIAVFVSEREADDRIDPRLLTKTLIRAYQLMTRRLSPLLKDMLASGFEGRAFYLRPAAAVNAWARGSSWERVLEAAETEEGDLAMLILRTADNLRHIAGLAEFRFDREVVDPAMEGGLSTEEYIERTKANLTRAAEVIGLAMAIEAARSGEELRPLIREAERLVGLAHGAAAAQSFIVGIRRRCGGPTGGYHSGLCRRAVPRPWCGA